VDNDCDGYADENCGTNCVNEICGDGVDNDCDGYADENGGTGGSGGGGNPTENYENYGVTVYGNDPAFVCNEGIKTPDTLHECTNSQVGVNMDFTHSLENDLQNGSNSRLYWLGSDYYTEYFEGSLGLYAGIRTGNQMQVGVETGGLWAGTQDSHDYFETDGKHTFNNPNSWVGWAQDSYKVMPGQSTYSLEMGVDDEEQENGGSNIIELNGKTVTYRGVVRDGELIVLSNL
jgi:hypothetical protein